MSVKTRKHSGRAKIQPRVVNQTRTSLQNLPEKKILSLQEAIHQLRVPLEGAIIKGYSYQELATILEQRGIPVNGSTLKTYLTSAKRIAATKKPEQQTKVEPSSSDNVIFEARVRDGRIEIPAEYRELMQRATTIQVKLVQQKRKKLSETRAFGSSDIDLKSQGIDREQAEALRASLSTFADDWDSPEMSIYDNYDAAKANI